MAPTLEQGPDGVTVRDAEGRAVALCRDHEQARAYVAALEGEPMAEPEKPKNNYDRVRRELDATNKRLREATPAPNPVQPKPQETSK